MAKETRGSPSGSLSGLCKLCFPVLGSPGLPPRSQPCTSPARTETESKRAGALGHYCAGAGGGGRLGQPLPAKDIVGGGEGALLHPSLSPELWHLLGLAAWVPAAMPAAENSSVLGRI